MQDLVQVFFIKSPTGKFKLGYSPNMIGYVKPELVEPLLAGGYIRPLLKEVPFKTGSEIKKTTQTKTPEVVKAVKAKVVDLTTPAKVQKEFGDDVDSMRLYCESKGIKVHKSVRHPKSFYTKIAAYHKKGNKKK